MRALIAHDVHIRSAAEELFVHSNTVYYRIEMIKKHCGVDIRKPSSLADLQFAMRCCEVDNLRHPLMR